MRVVAGAVAPVPEADDEVVRLRFALAAPAKGESSEILSAEEGTFENGGWVMRRRWNGDQADYGLNFTAQPVLLRVRLGSYR